METNTKELKKVTVLTEQYKILNQIREKKSKDLYNTSLIVENNIPYTTDGKVIVRIPQKDAFESFKDFADGRYKIVGEEVGKVGTELILQYESDRIPQCDRLYRDFQTSLTPADMKPFFINLQGKGDDLKVNYTKSIAESVSKTEPKVTISLLCLEKIKGQEYKVIFSPEKKQYYLSNDKVEIIICGLVLV